MLEYDFMRNAFAAAGVAAVVSGLVGYFLVLRGQTFAGHALGHIGFAGATGAVLIGLAPVWGLVGCHRCRRHRHGTDGRPAQRPRRRYRRRAGAGAGLRPVVSALLYGIRHPSDGVAVRQCACRRRRDDRNADRARRHNAGGAGRDHAAADFCQPAAGTGRSQGRAAALYLDRLSRHRRARGIRKRPDRRHPSRLQPDGRPAGCGATAGHRAVERHGAVGGSGARRGLARHRHRLLHRLAGQFLYRHAERAGLFRHPRQVAGCAGRRLPLPAWPGESPEALPHWMVAPIIDRALPGTG